MNSSTVAGTRDLLSFCVLSRPAYLKKEHREEALIDIIDEFE